MLDELAIENAVTSVLSGRYSYRDDKNFSDEQVRTLARAIAAAIRAYDEQIREQKQPEIVNATVI